MGLGHRERVLGLFFLFKFLSLANSTNLVHTHTQSSKSQVISAGSQIDTARPIIVTDQFSVSKSGGSLFGFATVLISDLAGEGWALIGAPTSNTSDRDYKQRQIHEPGVVWRCSLVREPPANKTCRILFVDPLNPQIGKADCRPNACPAEKHDGSGLGFSLAVNSERFVACAPRWQRQFGSSAPEISASAPTFKMNGICYWLPLQIALSEPFNIAPMISTGFRSQRLFPLLDKSMQLRENYPIWGWGQAGFAAHLAPTPGNELYLGAPGVNGWNGTVIKYEDEDKGNSSEPPRPPPPTPESIPHEIRLRPRPNTNGKPEFAEFSLLQTDFIQFYMHLEYLGFAITSGVYFQPGRRLVAVSAPRGGRLRGLVLVLDFPAQETPYWYPAQVLQGAVAAGGAGFGSYFGYTLESVDVNGDGLDELLVGAPWAMEQGEGREGDGCVYVYTATTMATNGRVRPLRFGRPVPICWSNDESELESTAEGAARFGAAIAGLGDLNGDGVNDFAVGASGEGAVYVYYGSKVEIPHTPAVRLTAEKLGLGRLGVGSIVTGFGMSIYGNGVDVDGNGAPDFIVGAPLSQQVVLVRTRPRTDFEGHVDAYIEHGPDGHRHAHAYAPNSDSEDAFIKVLPIHASQFIVRSCARTRARARANAGNSKATATESQFEIQITLNVDGELGRFTILAPLDSPAGEFEFERPGEGTVRYRANVLVDAQIEDVHCTEWIVHRVDHLATDPNPRPVRIFQELHYKGQDPHATAAKPAPESYKIFRNARGVPELKPDDEGDATSSNSRGTFCKFCPPSQRMLTELHIPLAVDNCDSDGVPACAPRLSVGVRFEQALSGKGDSHAKTFVLGTAKELRAVLQVSNEAGAETAYFPRLQLSWNSAVLTPSPWSNADCDWETSQQQLQQENLRSAMFCELGDRLQPNQTQIVTVTFPVAEYVARARNETLAFSAVVTAVTERESGRDQSESRLEPRLGVDLDAGAVTSANASILLLVDTQLKLEGSIENASMPRLTDAEAENSAAVALTKITHTYAIILEGSAPVGALHLSFWFPVRVANGLDPAQDLVFIGAPIAGRWNANACRIVTPNMTFYVDNSTTPTPKTRGIPRTPAPPYFVSTDGDDEVEIEEVEEEESEWVLQTTKTKTTTVTETTTYHVFEDEYEYARNSTGTTTVVVAKTNSSRHSSPTPSFESLADDSRGFLQRAGVTFAMRCGNADANADEEAGHSPNCVRVDCSLRGGSSGGVAPGRRILVRFPLYVRSGARARELYSNRTKTKHAKITLGHSQRLRASGLSTPWLGSASPPPRPSSRPAKVLIQSLARAHIFDLPAESPEESGADSENENVRYASFVTLLAVRDSGSDSDGNAYGRGTKVARLPMGWVYLISTTVGLLLLAALVYCLVKCGFFTRRRAPPTAPQWKALRAEEKERETVG